jgi:hypothetical protein
MQGGRRRHRWRDYSTPSGRRPVKKFLDGLDDVDAAAVVAAMKDVANEGVSVARHVRGDIYEVRASGDRASYRVLFAIEGRRALCSSRSRPSGSRPSGRHLVSSIWPSGGSQAGGVEHLEIDISRTIWKDGALGVRV